MIEVANAMRILHDLVLRSIVMFSDRVLSYVVFGGHT